MSAHLRRVHVVTQIFRGLTPQSDKSGSGSGLRLTLRGTKSLAETQLGIYFEDIFQSSAMNIFDKSRPVERLKIEKLLILLIFSFLI